MAESLGLDFDAIQLAIRFVVVGGVEVDGAKQVEDFEPLAALYVFFESGSDSGLFGGVVADLAGFFD